MPKRSPGSECIKFRRLFCAISFYQQASNHLQKLILSIWRLVFLQSWGVFGILEADECTIYSCQSYSFGLYQRSTASTSYCMSECLFCPVDHKGSALEASGWAYRVTYQVGKNHDRRYRQLRGCGSTQRRDVTAEILWLPKCPSRYYEIVVYTKMLAWNNTTQSSTAILI